MFIHAQERVIYNKEVQTAEISIEVTGPSEDEIRQRITHEVEAERAARDKELEEEAIKLDKEIEEEIRGITGPNIGSPVTHNYSRVEQRRTPECVRRTRILGLRGAVIKNCSTSTQRWLRLHS